MGQIAIANRSFEAPILVPSVSSFETFLKPDAALRLQTALAEPISLVSSYDIANSGPALINSCVEFRKNGVLLLDSGGYESSRIARYASTNWSFDRFRSVATEQIYDLVFSFDDFILEGEISRTFASRLVSKCGEYSSFLDLAKLIPVIHVVSQDGTRRLVDQEIVELCCTVATQLQCLFIAVPERELGSGIMARAKLVTEITNAVAKENPSCHLHILGCGNPLSFAILSVAGATMCDGLEWCRTYAAENFHLHHTQQCRLFSDSLVRQHPAGELILGGGLSYPVEVAARNLLTQSVFVDRIQKRLPHRNVHELVDTHFGAGAGDALRAIEA